VAVLVGLALNFIGLDPIKALIYSAVLNGLVAPIILFLIVSMSSNKKIMGENVNGPVLAVVGWLATSLMFLVGSATIVGLFW
jgi:Mn2+/Fe2+ NRAMP family transporter